MKNTGQDPSLLDKFKSGTVLALKDFTTVLSMHRDRRQEILSQLREIYDGSYVKSWGTGKTFSWKGKMGLIAGVTTVIDMHYSIYQTLGERFVQYRIKQPDPVDVAKIAMESQGHESEMREELRHTLKEFFKSRDFKNVPEIDDDVENRLAWLATFCVRARSGVIRGQYGNKDIEYVPEPEGPARLAKQLKIFLKGLTVCGADGDSYELTCRLALDSIHKIRLSVITALYQQGNSFISTAQIAAKIKYPPNTVRRYLEDLTALEVLQVDKGGKGKADFYRLSGMSLKALKNSGCGAILNTVPQTSGGT